MVDYLLFFAVVNDLDLIAISIFLDEVFEVTSVDLFTKTQVTSSYGIIQFVQK